MTPLTPEQMRALTTDMREIASATSMDSPGPAQFRLLADVHEGNQRRGNAVQPWILESTIIALRTAADKLDAVRALIENAPHGEECDSKGWVVDGGWGVDESHCDCWKADVL